VDGIREFFEKRRVEKVERKRGKKGGEQ
jgi:hypothetical protein